MHIKVVRIIHFIDLLVIRGYIRSWKFTLR